MPDDREDSIHDLPYAQAYLRETTYFGPLSEAHIPWRWTLKPDHGAYLAPHATDIADEDFPVKLGKDFMHVSQDKADKRHNKIIRQHSMYCEVQVSCVGSRLPKWKSIALNEVLAHGSLALIEYGDDGWIRGRSVRCPIQQEGYGLGDVVGCGFIIPRTVFFTKNGRELCTLQLAGDDPCVSIEFSFTGAALRANFGQKPFVFDINAHFHAAFARPRWLASTIPNETLEMVLTHALSSLPEFSSDARGRRTGNMLLGLSQVCRRWRSLCIRHLFPQLRLNTSLEFAFASRMPFCRYNALELFEAANTPWLHTFFVSRLLSRLASVTSWGYDGQSIGFYGGLPPKVLPTIPALIRNTFSTVVFLSLKDCVFPTWTDFAKFVFAFPALVRLELDPSVRWDRPPPELPPIWLRSPRSLKEIVHGQLSKYHLWLLIVGCQYRPSGRQNTVLYPSHSLTLSQQDAAILCALINAAIPDSETQLSHMDFNVCGTIGTLSWSNAKFFPPYDSIYISLQFQKYGELNALAQIKLRWRHNHLPSFEKINTLLERLSSSSICRCEVDLTEARRSRSDAYARVESAREKVLFYMSERYAAGLLTFSDRGEAMPSIHLGVAWMWSPSPTFSSPTSQSTWTAGSSALVSWDISSVRPDGQVIPWLKLFRRGPHGHVFYLTDLAQEVDPCQGKVQVTIRPDMELHAGDRYIVIVGNYKYRTEPFKIKPAPHVPIAIAAPRGLPTSGIPDEQREQTILPGELAILNNFSAAPGWDAFLIEPTQ